MSLMLLVIVGCGGSLGDSSGLPSKKMDAGNYDAFSVQKAFNRDSGEPVYYILASQVTHDYLKNDSTGVSHKINYPVSETKFYEVPRSRVVSLPFGDDADPYYIYRGLIEVK